jgi:hypothetical protein
VLVSDWVNNISERLSDYRKANPAALNNRFWSKELIESFYQSAYATIASANPEEFGVTKIIRLKVGSTQSTDCDMTGQVTQFVDKDGNALGAVRAISKRPTFVIDCHADAHLYKPRESFNVSSREFEIYPPVPEGCAVYVKLKCIDITASATGTVPAKYSNMITEWAMFSALSGDADTSVASMAQVHYKAFFDLIKMQKQVDEAFRTKVKANDA